MKILLRSVFTSVPTDNADAFLQNFLALNESGLGFDVQEDTQIWEFIYSFVAAHNHVPNLSTLRSHFEREGQTSAIDRLEMLSVISPRTRGDFLKHLEDKAEDRRTRVLSEVLKEAGSIITSGFEVKLGREKHILKGPTDAIKYVLERSQEIIAPTTGVRLSGNVVKDGEDFWSHYQKVKIDRNAAIGRLCGLEQMDLALNGARPGEMWLHAGFPGHGKSIFALNWAYTQSIWYYSPTCVFSLEMTYRQCRNMLHAMHTYHDKFRPLRCELGIQRKEDPNYDRGLEYRDIRDGTLSDREELFLKAVVDDFNDPRNDYGGIHVEVRDPDKPDFTYVDLKARAELIHSKTPFRQLFIDHIGLMSARTRRASYTEAQNEVLRDLHMLSQNFHRGAGIPVVGLFQINREGYKAALKNGGNYNLTHLSYANEAEKSSDIVTTGWLDEELKKAGRIRFQNLKARDDAMFEPFHARVLFHCRRMLTDTGYEQSSPEQRERVGKAIDDMSSSEIENVINQMVG